MKVSIVIPTKNAGPAFGGILEAVLSQRAPWPFEVIVVDSGSSDGTLAQARGKNVRVLTIRPEEFGHGRTRNFAISQSEGDFIAMITHDAKPASPDWLAKLVAAAGQHPEIAGAFGRHLPYPDADPYTARDLDLHFEGFRLHPIDRMEDRDRYDRDAGYRQRLHFFSDNNACLRRSVWERFPYPDVEFAEDQIWAKTVIEAGYAKAYAHDAPVFHSHSFGVIESGRRAYDEAAAMRRLFGYDMCPSIAHGIKHAIACSINDVRWSLTQPQWPRQARWMARAPFAHSARQIGYYLGGRQAALPEWLRDGLSRDRAFKKSSATSA